MPMIHDTSDKYFYVVPKVYANKQLLCELQMNYKSYIYLETRNKSLFKYLPHCTIERPVPQNIWKRASK